LLSARPYLQGRFGVFKDGQIQFWLKTSSRRRTMKSPAVLAVAVAAIGLSSLASAQTRIAAEHAETDLALKCLLDHDPKGCKYDFVGSAWVAAKPWLRWSPNREFELGAVQSSQYAGTQPPNAYTTKFLYGRTADVYDVKFAHQQKTFYIVPPGPDGKIQYLLIRSGAPDDERREGFVTSRIR